MLTVQILTSISDFEYKFYVSTDQNKTNTDWKDQNIQNLAVYLYIYSKTDMKFH